MRACEAHFSLLDARLAAHPYLAGETFTLGDIPAGTTLYRYLEMGLDVSLPAHVEAWYTRLRERPAYREHIMVPFDARYGRLDF